jgi:hypothetical protein
MFIYQKTGETIEIIVRDNTHKKLDTFKFNIADKHLARGILSHIQKKYGFSPEISPDESIDELERLRNMNKKKDFLDL